MLRDHTRSALLLPLLVAVFFLMSGPSRASDSWTWIWAGGQGSPPETLYFRQRFHLTHQPLSARLLITADDSFVAYLNEHTEPVTTGNDWTTVQSIDVTPWIQAGDNLLAVQARNTGGTAGLLYKLIIKEAGGRQRTIYSDAHVRVNRHPPVAWITFALDDKNWPFAREIAPANQGAWGALRGAPEPDYGRIVRVWDIRSGVDPYARPRLPGERMLLSASVASPSDMQILANAGFTLFQTDSDHLSTEELAPGRWDWQHADAAQSLVQRMGLDWSYFEHEAFPPKWYRDSMPFTRISALDDGQPIQAFSLWDTHWPGFVAQGYQALAHEFGPVKTTAPARTQPASLSAICVGIHGDYGLAGLFTGARMTVAGQKEDWIRRFNNENDHLAFWCDDPDARADFRATMMRRYSTLDALNAAWNTDYKAPIEIGYPSDVNEIPEVAARRHYLDFIDWYRGGIGHAVEINLAAARRYFPNTLLIVPAGLADENLRGADDNSLLPKLAARYSATVRAALGGYKAFSDNAATMMGRLGSASRFYGAPFWTEAPGSLTADKTVERIYEAASQGCAGYFDWANNVVANKEVYYRYGRFLRYDRPVKDVAMFYPAVGQELRPDQGYNYTFSRACAYLRDIADYDIVDDRMVRDGCLSNYRILALWEGMRCDQATLDAIKAWVDAGGVLVAYDFGKVTTIGGDIAWFKDLFGYVQDLPPAHVSERYVGQTPAQYRLDVGRPETADYLDGVWYEPKTENNEIVRWTGANATVSLPVDPDRHYALVVRAEVPEAASSLQHELILNGHKLGDLSATGDARYRFLIPDGEIEDGSTLATLTFHSDTIQPAATDPKSRDRRDLGVRVQSVALIETDVDEASDAPPPPGVIKRDLDLTHLTSASSNDSWVRRYGKGLTVFFPASRSLLRGYIEVLRQTIYHLSAIDPARRDALPVDDGADGVYATLFRDRILYYNAQDIPITKRVSIPAAAFDAWKNDVSVPAENSWTLELKPHSIEAIFLAPPPQDLLYECEAFTELNGMKPEAASDCSPGEGASCVKLRAGSAIETRFRIAVPGRYTVYTRCLHGMKLEPADIEIDGHKVGALDRPAGQTLMSGGVNLVRGTHALVLRARAGRALRADFVLISNDANVAGFTFAMRTASVQ